jgi:NADH-quinone oxidoreductase subunit N
MMGAWENLWRESLRFFLPELILLGGMLLVLLADLVVRRDRGVTVKLLAVATLAAATFLAWLEPTLVGSEMASSVNSGINAQGTFAGLLSYDPLAVYFRILLPFITLLALVASFFSRELRRVRMGEFCALMLAATLGMVLLAESQNLLMLFLALELVSIPSYVLAGYLRRDRAGAEASLKYILVGAISAGCMLYGITLLYGLSGSYDLSGIQIYLTNVHLVGVDRFTFLFAGILVLAGFGFKVAAVPFHFWAPDVYTGAPTPVTAFLTVGPKAAGFAAILRFFLVGVGGHHNALIESSGVNWPALLMALSIMTMTLGNLAAFFQENMKRLLGYSSIAHAGYMLMGVVVLDKAGVMAILLYLFVYLFMNLGAFFVLMLTHDKTGSVELSSLRGLGRSSPLLALAMAIFVISLMGIPPLAGFVPKWYLLLAVVREGHYVFAILAGLNFVFAYFYYARILRAMYMERTPATQGAPGGEPPAAVPAVVRLPIQRFAFLLLLVLPNLFFLWPLWRPMDRLAELSARLLYLGF